MQAIVLAGQRNHGALRTVSEVLYEGDIPILGRPMLDWVLDGLANAQSVDRIVVVGPASAARPGVQLVPMREDLFANIMAGLDRIEPTDRILIATGDIPLLERSVVDAFVRMAPSADLVYPAVPKAAVEALFPDAQRTYVRLREGVFTGGNIFLVDPTILPRVREQAEILLSHRKSPIKLVKDIGMTLLVKFLVGQLSIADAERRIYQLLGVRGRGLIFPYPEVGVDVDKPSDLDVVARHLAARHAQDAGRRQ